MKRETRAWIQKASRAIVAAKVLLRRGDADFAVGRAYHAMLYTAAALLHECGAGTNPPANTHEEVTRKFGEQFVTKGNFTRFHRWLLDGHDVWIFGEYHVGPAVAPDQARRAISRALEFSFEARRQLGALRTPSTPMRAAIRGRP